MGSNMPWMNTCDNIVVMEDKKITVLSIYNNSLQEANLLDLNEFSVVYHLKLVLFIISNSILIEWSSMLRI